LSRSDRSKDVHELSSVTPDKKGVYTIAHTPAATAASIVVIKYAWPLLFFALNYAIYIFKKAIALEHLYSIELIGCLFFLSYFSSYMALLFCFLYKDFVLRQKGIALPFVYFWEGLGRLNWKWSELTDVIFSRSDPNIATADQLVLRFKVQDNPIPVDIHIKLKEISQIDLKKLIYAIVANAPQAVMDPPLDKVALEFPTVSGIKQLNFNSFTSLWDEEFSTRYSPTLFVPLAPDEELRGGAIRISEMVACGGSAAIYAAKDLRGTQIIVKEAVIPKNANAELKAKAIEMFNREAMFLSKLDHPNIAKVLDHFVENEHHYEVIEFIDGLDLRRFVKERGPQPEDFVLNWAEQICEIVVYLHSQDPPIIHRDLTPDNLVLRVDGQLVLIDFGAANAFVGIATGTMVGKQSYMPPEQLRGKAVPQSDIYSLGATIYFLLTSKDPTPLEVSQVDSSVHVSPMLNQLLAKCTASEVANRQSSVLELLREIRNIRKQRQVDAVSTLTSS
jgi:tRNA A-37 threonylcarbamoyl transferase component Bud32